MNSLKMRAVISLFAFFFFGFAMLMPAVSFAATARGAKLAAARVASSTKSAVSWTELAKKVGESEENRAAVIAALRKIPDLKSKLQKAIYSKDRPLALDVISSLDMKDLIPDLLLHVPADPDGFLTVAINSMMDAKNQSAILNAYTENLAASSGVSNAAIVAMLEPLGRLSIALPRTTLEALRDSGSPEVRSSLIYYLRIMSIRNHKTDNLDILASLSKASEFQIRLQVVSVASEILALNAKAPAGLPARTDLKSICDTEKTSSIKSACYGFLALAPRGPASIAPMCTTMEKSLYARDTLKVRMVFGYKDARPARFVGDRHERLAFIERITSICQDDSNNNVCGFARSHDNADLFMKKTRVHGREHRVLLWVVNSSVGTDDQENRQDPFQKWKSKYAEEAFTTGLHDADVVLYDGHSRFGGGPDFTSPNLADDGTVDPIGYQSSRPGLTKMISALKAPAKASGQSARATKTASSSKLKILGLFSCSSSQHFNEEIHAVSKAGVVSSKVLMYYSDALQQSLGTLDDVLSGRCPKAISF